VIENKATRPYGGELRKATIFIKGNIDYGELPVDKIEIEYDNQKDLLSNGLKVIRIPEIPPRTSIKLSASTKLPVDGVEPFQVG
jgi:hypothetical protein